MHLSRAQCSLEFLVHEMYPCFDTESSTSDILAHLLLLEPSTCRCLARNLGDFEEHFDCLPMTFLDARKFLDACLQAAGT